MFEVLGELSFNFMRAWSGTTSLIYFLFVFVSSWMTLFSLFDLTYRYVMQGWDRDG